jgi:uncharacterized protein (DUF697 family)
MKPGCPATSTTEAMLTMVPLPWFRMVGITALQANHTPREFC